MIELENYIGKYVLLETSNYTWIGKLVHAEGASFIQVRELIRIKPTIYVQFLENFFALVTVCISHEIIPKLPSKEEFNEYLKIKRKVVFLGHP